MFYRTEFGMFAGALGDERLKEIGAEPATQADFDKHVKTMADAAEKGRTAAEAAADKAVKAARAGKVKAQKKLADALKIDMADLEAALA